MARNRGKRPSTASGSASPSQGQAKDGQTKAGTASSVTGTASSATGATSPATGTASSAAGTASSAAGATSPPAGSKAATNTAGKASSEATKTAAAAKGAATASSGSSVSTGSRPQASTTVGSGAGQGGGSSDSSGFWPGLIGGVIGGAATALAASLFWVGGDGEAVTTLESRVTATEQRAAEVEGLTERVASIEAAEATPEAEGDASGEMAARMDDLETKLTALGDASSGEASSSDNSELQDQLASLQQQVEALAGELQTAGEAQQVSAQSLTSLEAALPTLEGTLNQSVETLNGDVQTLATRVGDAEGRLDHLGGEYQRGAAMIVAIGDVDRAITKAEPFDSSLQSLKLLMRDNATLGETLSLLEPVATEGVPALPDLKDAFTSMASRALLAEGGNQSLADQVSNNVFGIINMRPAGSEAEGGSSRATFARAQARLAADDLESAIAELGGLEGAAGEEAKGWIEQAQGRLSAEAAVVDLRAHAQALVAEGS